ncbi:hypothetical protein Acr_15g0000110 [Actinidia rufa]|uniref:Hydroxyproline-rich glycoprotein family protein n=1 Tax=Actinidia rufa TaxID=165716 RepID=A0A7J0FRR1_9ERIC|nr:hypothetical protein Acr_15g0000110 [Actinidia rufa]
MENSCRRLLATHKLMTGITLNCNICLSIPINRRWGSCWNIYSCFGSHKQKRIGHAVLVPETSAQGTEVPAAENATQAPAIVLPFIAPPSSPASFLQSEPPSWPYAHETQLVSPPVFSTFTTEPSTAPFTPPPESVQLTTPSSPEVPFARLLDPNHQNGEVGHRFPFSQYEFQCYQPYPESPVSNLISPSSGISGSGTSSPFPDREFTPGGPSFLQFRIGDPPKLLNLDKLTAREWRSWQGSGSLTPDTLGPRSRDEDVVRCMAKEPSLAKAVSPSTNNAQFPAKKNEISIAVVNNHDDHLREIPDDTTEKAFAEGEDEQRPQRHRSITLGSVKEFNFDNADGGEPNKPGIGSDWWANEKVLGKESGGPSKNWSFFPMMHPGVS